MDLQAEVESIRPICNLDLFKSSLPRDGDEVRQTAKLYGRMYQVAQMIGDQSQMSNLKDLLLHIRYLATYHLSPLYGPDPILEYDYSIIYERYFPELSLDIRKAPWFHSFYDEYLERGEEALNEEESSKINTCGESMERSDNNMITDLSSETGSNSNNNADVLLVTDISNIDRCSSAPGYSGSEKLDNNISTDLSSGSEIFDINISTDLSSGSENEIDNNISTDLSPECEVSSSVDDNEHQTPYDVENGQQQTLYNMGPTTRQLAEITVGEAFEYELYVDSTHYDGVVLDEYIEFYDHSNTIKVYKIRNEMSVQELLDQGFYQKYDFRFDTRSSMCYSAFTGAQIYNGKDFTMISKNKKRNRIKNELRSLAASSFQELGKAFLNWIIADFGKSQCPTKLTADPTVIDEGKH